MHTLSLHPRLLIAGLLLALPALVQAASPLTLFDGKSLAGWEGDSTWWRVQDGVIMGGSRTDKIPRNFFLSTTRSFRNFDLTLKIRLSGVAGTGMINSGVQLRSVRLENSTEMFGYQVDAGEGWWGKLYDESRRKKVIGESADPTAVKAAVRTGDWNEVRILAEEKRIRTWINGVPALDYTEQDDSIALDGKIGLQIHSGGIAWAEFKDITLKELPAKH